jgi:hypothetical protein
MELGQVAGRASAVDDVLEKAGHAVGGAAGGDEFGSQPGPALDEGGKRSGADGDG